MKGDYIYCLNPECHMLSKDIHEILDTRDDKVKAMCPYCYGTNTINANKTISQKFRGQLLLKTRTTTLRKLRHYAEKLKKEQILTKYRIQANKKTHTLYLYDRSNDIQTILNKAKEQNIVLSPITC